jgi:hypothetical protein
VNDGDISRALVYAMNSDWITEQEVLRLIDRADHLRDDMSGQPLDRWQTLLREHRGLLDSVDIVMGGGNEPPEDWDPDEWT